MSKTLRTAALVVGAVALAATGVGAAVSAGLVAASATTATIATIAAYASLASLALTAAASLTAKKPSVMSTGSPDQWSADPQGYVPYWIGRTCTAGEIIFRRAWDTADKGDNDRQAFVSVFSVCQITSIEATLIDQATVTFNEFGQALGAYSGSMWQTYQLGASPEPNALSFGVGAGTPPGWDAARKLSGLAADTVTLRFDTKGKLFQNGVPKRRVVGLGVKVYDPRLDSTYPGGSGPCRAFDESTYVPSRNPHLHGLTWLLGRWQNGIRVIGVGCALAGIDVPAYVEGANISDLNGWKVGGIVYSGDNKWDVLKKILQAGMAEPMNLGAQVSCFTNAPKVSLATITVGDVVGAASVTATQPRRDRINGIVPRYWQEANDWQFLPGSAVRVPLHETEDGGRRTKTVDYAFIPSDAAGPDFSDKQIAVACRYDIENAREFGPITLPLKLRWIGYKAGDCVTANLPELGLNSQTILLTNRDFDPSTGTPTFTARSETTAKHAFALGQISEPPPTPGVSAEALVPVPGPTAWEIVATSITKGESSVAALVIDGAVDSGVAEAIIVDYRLWISGQAADAGWVAWGISPPTANEFVITGIEPGSTYEVGISYRRRGVVGGRTILGPVVAGATQLDYQYVTGPTRPADNATVGAPAGTLVGTKLAEQLVADSDSAQEIIAEILGREQTNSIAQLQASLSVEALRKRIDDLTHMDGATVKMTVRDLSAALTTANAVIAANYLELIDAVATETEARVEAIETLEASFDSDISDVEALVASEATARASADSAEATTRAAAIATLTTNLATANAAITAEATARATADSAEVTTRAAAIATLTTDVATNAAAITSETAARISAVAGEASSRGALAVTVGNQGASIVDIKSAVIDPQSGITTKVTMGLNSGGHVVGYVATNNGSTGDIVFDFDSYTLLDPSGNIMIYASGGSVYMPHVVIDTLAVGAVVTGSIASGAVSGLVYATASPALAGTGAGSWQSAVSATFTLDATADVLTIVTGRNGYSSAAQPWACRVRLDSGGELGAATGATFGTDSFSFQGPIGGVSAGSHTAYVEWYATNSGMTLVAVQISVFWRKR